MKSMTKLAIGAAVVLLIGAGLQPAHAACPIPGFQITFAGAYVVSNPNWCGGGGYGCYEAAGGAAISPNFNGFFWGQSGSNEFVGAGVDNGAWAGHQGQGANGWIKAVSAQFGDLYHYPAFISQDTGDYANIPGTDLNWAGTNLIDGCITDIAAPSLADRCTCVLLTDEWSGTGYYAIISKQANSSGDFLFNEVPGTQFNLSPIPRPEVISSTRDSATATVTFSVNVADPTGGDYRDPNCACNFGFRVFRAVMPEGGMPPSTRAACTEKALSAATGGSLTYNDPGFIDACLANGFVWVPASDLSGLAQPVTPFGGARAAATVSVDCGDPLLGYDVYLATSLGANEGTAGLQLTNVSQSSFQVKCGDYQLAEPNRPERPSATTPGRSGDAPRGRDNNRGNRER